MHNADITMSVEARVIGKRRSPDPPWYVELPAELRQKTEETENPFLLRHLIEYLVREEVRSFQFRQKERNLIHVLSPQQIADAAKSGKVVMGGMEDLRWRENNDPIDEDAAVQVALQGFIDGLYVVFIDKQQQKDLDQSVKIYAGSTLLFIRLVALVGG